MSIEEKFCPECKVSMKLEYSGYAGENTAYSVSLMKSPVQTGQADIITILDNPN